MQKVGPSTLEEEVDKPLRVNTLAVKTFFFLGERLALIALFIAAGLIISFQNSELAFSQNPEESITINYPSPAVTQENGGLIFAQAAQAEVSKMFIATPTATPTPFPPTLTPTPILSTPTPTVEPTLTPTPIPTTNPQPATLSVDPNDNAIWDRIAECESRNNWSINTGNGYFGGLQFSQGTWNSVGGSGSPHEASREEQIIRGKMLQAARGWGAWGDCAKRLGL